MPSALKFPLFAAILFSGTFFIQPVFAGDFGQVFIRLDRTQVSQPTGGLICATAETAGVESKVEVAFPNGFSVNSGSANWTVGTSDIPNNATAWPGISTASAISSQTVTFPSSDLNTGILYCFTFSENNTLTNNSSATANNLATITTRNAANGIIDQKGISLPNLISDHVTVSARVGAHPEDFITHTGNSSQKDRYIQNDVILYDISYGSLLPFAASIILEAEWTLGSIDDLQIPSVDLLEYVIGSAGSAYGGASPVVDLTNRKIRWTITNFPADTVDQNVTFKLRTRGVYTGSKDVLFEVKSRIYFPLDNVVSVDSIKSDRYLYDPDANISPTPAPSASPSSVPVLPGEVFTGLDIRQVDSSSVEIFATLANSSSLTVRYGTSANKLNNTLRSPAKSFEHTLRIDNLTPDTIYFFRLEALNDRGRIVVSDLFTFKTAKISELSNIDPESLVLTSARVIIYSPSALNPGINPFVVVPSENVLEFKFSIKNPGSITQIQTIQRLAQVLGIISTEEIETGSDLTGAMEIGEGVYYSRLKVPKEVGLYDVFAKVFDQNGNISEQSLFKLKVVDSMKVVNLKNEPIENARVYLYIYNPRKKLYELISPQAVNIKNPSLSNHQGVVGVVLPKGEYKAEIIALGYKEKTVTFRIGEGRDEGYPVIALEVGGFGVASTTKYYFLTALDILDSTSGFIKSLSISIRFFDFLFFTLIGILVFLTLISFTLRTHISPLLLPHILLFELRKISSRESINQFVSGKIFDQENKSPLGSVSLFVLNEKLHQIAGEVKTNSKGEFIFKKPKYTFSLMAVKKGYELLEDIYF
jgi:hypothetical protein